MVNSMSDLSQNGLAVTRYLTGLVAYAILMYNEGLRTAGNERKVIKWLKREL